MTCPKCKSETGSAKFCPECGKNLTAVGKVSASEEFVPDKEETAGSRRGNKNIYILAATFVAIVVVVIIAVIQANSKPELPVSATRGIVEHTTAKLTVPPTTMNPMVRDFMHELNLNEDDATSNMFILRAIGIDSMYINGDEVEDGSVGEFDATVTVDNVSLQIWFSKGLIQKIVADGDILMYNRVGVDGEWGPSFYEYKEEKLENNYKNGCESIKYSELARNPSKFNGKNIKIHGRVIQVIEDGVDITLRVAVTQGRYGTWDDVIMVGLEIYQWEDRILEDDIITIWGECKGSHTYESVMGGMITVPAMIGKYFSIQ